MKTATIAAFATPVLCGLLVALPTASGAKPSTTITVPFFDVDFVIEAYDAGDDTTYEVTFTDFGFESVYEFDHDGVVTAITAENERYKMIYKKKNGKLKKVKLVSSRRQLGDPREGTNNMDVDQTTPSGRHSVELAPAGSRRLGECGDCTYMWDTLCDQGVETVCDLEGYGNPFSSTAETSIQVFCDSFEKLCKRNTADGVCEGECGGNECLPPLTIKLEHTGGFGEEATLVDLFVVQPGGQTAYFDNAETVSTWISQQGRLCRPQRPAQVHTRAGAVPNPPRLNMFIRKLVARAFQGIRFNAAHLCLPRRTFLSHGSKTAFLASRTTEERKTRDTSGVSSLVYAFLFRVAGLVNPKSPEVQHCFLNNSFGFTPRPRPWGCSSGQWNLCFPPISF